MQARADALPEVNVWGSFLRYQDPGFFNSPNIDEFPPEILQAFRPIASNLWDGNVLNVLEAARYVGAKVYQASTSELFGSSAPPQNEKTAFHPRSPYGVAKLAAYWQTVNYREAYGMYACNGILFNHESPRRGAEFVTQKVVRAAVRRQKVRLGNLDAKRDWGHAKDYVKAMWLMLQQDKPEDFVVATGEAYSVRQLCELSYSLAGLDWKDYVETDDSLKRPAEVDFLLGDPRKIESLGWKREYDVETLIREMFAYAVHAAH